MKIKITSPVPERELRAGLVYDLPDDIAQSLIDQERGFAFDGDDIPVTTIADQFHVSVEVKKPRRKATK